VEGCTVARNRRLERNIIAGAENSRAMVAEETIDQDNVTVIWPKLLTRQRNPEPCGMMGGATTRKLQP
jgi:hypothetical protein